MNFETILIYPPRRGCTGHTPGLKSLQPSVEEPLLLPTALVIGVISFLRLRTFILRARAAIRFLLFLELLFGRCFIESKLYTGFFRDLVDLWSKMDCIEAS